MRYLISSFFLILSGLSFSQANETVSNKLNLEFAVSTNYSLFFTEHTQGKIGAGFSINHFWKSDRIVNLGIGLNYNLSSQIKDQIYQGHFSSLYYPKIYISCLSIPIISRFFLLKNRKMFIEVGVYPELNMKVKAVTSSGVSEVAHKRTNFGGLSSLGAVVSIKRYELIIKLGCNYAFRNFGAPPDILANRYAFVSFGLRKIGK